MPRESFRVFFGFDEGEMKPSAREQQRLADARERIRDQLREHPDEIARLALSANTLRLEGSELQIFGGQLYRDLAEAVRGVDEEKREVELAFSSEIAYPRWFGTEILGHEDGEANLDRLNNGAPLLFNHWRDDHLGIHESARIDADRIGRAVVRFGSGALASEKFADVRDGILTKTSVGYWVHSVEQLRDADGNPELDEDGLPIYRVTSWEPLENSLVTIPADDSVGVGRAIDDRRRVLITARQNAMENATNTGTPSRGQRRASARDRAAEEERRSEIGATAEMWEESHPHIMEEAKRAIIKGTSLREFQDWVLKQVENAEPVSIGHGFRSLDEAIGDPGFGELARGFSLRRAILAQVDPSRFGREGGLELEVSREIEHRTGRKPRHNGILVPIGVAQRDVTKGGSGGNLIATDLLAGAFINDLFARSVVMELGAQSLTGLVGDVAIPRKTAGGTPYWIAGDGSDTITESTPTFDQVTLAPKTVGALTTFSRKALLQATPGIEMLISNDFAEKLATEVDKQAIQGDGAGNTPTGILSTTGVGTSSAAGSTPTYPEIIGAESGVAAANAAMGSLAYITNPTIAGNLKATERGGTGSGTFVWENSGQPGEGIMNGFRSLSTSNVPAQTVVFGNFNDLLIGTWGILEIEANPYDATDWAAGNVTVRALLDVDVALRHPASFHVITTT